MDNGFILKKESLVTVCYSVQESKAVKRSIRNLRNDIEKVIGCQCEEMLCGEGKREKGLCIMAGTIGKNKEVDIKIGQGLLDVDSILDENGNYRLSLIHI